MSKRLILTAAVALMFFSSAGIVTFLSAQEGSGVAPASAAPREITPASLESRYAPDRIYRTGGDAVWRVSHDLGVLVSTDGGATWTTRNDGLPRRAIYPFTSEMPPVITGLSVDPVDGDHVALSTLDTIFLSKDAGVTWEKVELKAPIRANDQLTCIALAPGDDNVIAVGTSFHGFFESRNRGRSWTSLSEALTPLQLGGGNYEEIASLTYDPVTRDTIWFSLGFGKGVYTLRRGGRTADQVALPSTPTATPVRNLAFYRRGTQEPWHIDVLTDTARWTYTPATGGWKMADSIEPEVSLSPEKADRLATAAERYGIYVAPQFATGDRFAKHLEFLKVEGLNSIVVDFKDDYGYVTYDTALPLPRRIGAVKERFKIDDLVKAAHENGLYLIGRMVVFRDKQLYNADGYRYAAWDAAAKQPWRYLKKSTDEQTGQETIYQGEYWVDPYSEEVWDYNIAIAREMADHGVDEVQFDYIRFPSDGNVSGITWRYRRPDMGKMEALESFLSKARDSLTCPISADVYGYSGWARISNWVAQNIEMYSRYVDVIQPMFYPSHFPRDFLGSMEYLERAEYIYREGTRRAAFIVEGRSIIRPYVQAFRLGGELSFKPAAYSTYLTNQVEGSLEGAGSGFTLWNASNDYYMVTQPLGPIIEQTLAVRNAR